MAETTKSEAALYERVAEILEAARAGAARSVNVAMVRAYWLIGREIVQVEQGGARRAGYGEKLLARLSKRLENRFGAAVSLSSLERIRRFYLTYPVGTAALEGSKKIPSAVLTELGTRVSEDGAPVFPSQLGWSHYLLLMRVKNPQARAFYEIEAARECWSTRELERQVASLLFDRLAKSRSPEQVRALAREGLEIATPQDVLKEPLVLEFLDLDEQPGWRERDLESALIDRLSGFLLELGKGFCFVGRQKRISLDGDHYFIDLVFYHRLLRCFVLFDLKLGKLTHQDLGQMKMCVNFYDAYQLGPGDAPTIGIVLCSEKNEAMVRITLPDADERVMAAKYQTWLPSEAELSRALTEKRREAERLLELARSEATSKGKKPKNTCAR